MFLGVLVFAKRLDWVRRIGLSLLIPYLFLVFAVTVFLRAPSTSSNIVLEPFQSYRQYLIDDFTWFEIRANILLFIPAGILLPMVIRKPFFLPVIAGIGCSVVIELIQFVTHRGLCETDDVISNTIGLLIGFGAFWLAKAIVILIKHIIISNSNNKE